MPHPLSKPGSPDVSASPAPGSSVDPASPCVNLCRLDRSGFCEGCLRSAMEIELWPEMDAERRWRLLGELRRRRTARDTGRVCD